MMKAPAPVPSVQSSMEMPAPLISACRGLLLAALLLSGLPAAAAELHIGYLTRAAPPPPALALIEERRPDEGLAGAKLAIADDNTTGRFLKQGFVLDPVTVPEDSDAVAGFRDLAGRG